MSEINLTFSDDRTTLNIIEDKTVVELSEPGIQGAAGPGIEVRGSVATVEDLPTDATPNDTYFIGSDAYIWTGNEWINAGVVRGADGADGADGIDGANGLNTYQGEGAPLITARVGETYIDTTTGDVYEWQ